METERTCTAMYDTRGAAEAARDDLMALGVEEDAISIRGAEDRREPGAGRELGLFAGIVDLFLPEEDQRLYTEGVRRGAYLVSVRVPPGMEDEVADAMERAEPVDLDFRPQGWNAGSGSAMPTEMTDRELSRPIPEPGSRISREESASSARPAGGRPRVRRYEAARRDPGGRPDRQPS